MYTTIRLRNVRAWADSGDIALAPLTLFYGANGAGKSSIAQALDALARIADRGFTDPAALVAALPSIQTDHGTDPGNCAPGRGISLIVFAFL